MTFKEFIIELKKENLMLLDRLDGTYSIGSPKFANPIIIFNPSEEYQGTVFVKSINSTLFTSLQISKALDLVDKFLYTKPSDREM